MHRIAVYCGSRSGDSSVFTTAATELARLSGVPLGRQFVGDGAVADAALASGEVIGGF